MAELALILIGSAFAGVAGGIAGKMSKPKTPPPIAPPPTREDDSGGALTQAAQEQLRRAALAQGSQSTILGGSTAGAQPFSKTLLGE